MLLKKVQNYSSSNVKSWAISCKFCLSKTSWIWSNCSAWAEVCLCKQYLLWSLQMEGKVSQPDISAKDTESEWKLFWWVNTSSSLKTDLLRLISKGDLAATFPNQSKLAAILEVLPVTNCHCHAPPVAWN